MKYGCGKSDSAILAAHAVSWFSALWRRIQGDGTRTVPPTLIPRGDAENCTPPSGRRVRAGPEILPSIRASNCARQFIVRHDPTIPCVQSEQGAATAPPSMAIRRDHGHARKCCHSRLAWARTSAPGRCLSVDRLGFP